MLYTEDVKNRVKLNTWLTKEHIVERKMDEVFEDYQAIYDKTVEMQGDKEVGRSEGGRVR